jgi:dTDP-4-dehydrorhamnose reductase
MKSQTPGLGSRLELWGGVECSVVRLGEAFRDQIAETGHRDRSDDLQAIAALGIRTLRYPVVWEAVAPDHPDACEWGWFDRQMSRLRQLGIRPIAGLVHHGSGPRYTNLLDPAFPELLARHAGRVAERYPWVEMFTPVNEPLTTARFSALYGHWYPHAADLGSFLRAVAIQCRAVVLAMRAIRRVNPRAKLVQTEDLGRTFSTPALRHQAKHENERRWLSLDLLCGHVDRDHPWYRVFLEHGVGEAELDLFEEADAAPDIVGINHYLTSERFLDERHHRFPADARGGNGRNVYADVEAVRMHLPGRMLGPKARLHEAWLRYGRPVAVTEVHHGCSREEQMRWFMEVWNAAAELKAGGADIRAVTAWGLFGAVDWRSLLRRQDGSYDPGAFDIRAPAPRRTAIGRVAAALAVSGTFAHPVLDRPGWWRRHERFYHPPERPAGGSAPRCRPILIACDGTLGQDFARICAHRGLDHAFLRLHEMDGADPASIALALDRLRPWAVIDVRGERDVEHGPGLRLVAGAVRRAAVLSRACAERGLPFLAVSSHRVFGCGLGRPHVESDPVSPVCASGRGEVEVEAKVAQEHPGALIVRTGPLFGFSGGRDLVVRTLQSLASGRPAVWEPGVVSPTYVPDFVHAALDLLLDEESGIWHLANMGATSWSSFSERLAEAAGLDQRRVRGVDAGPITALASERHGLMPTLDSAVRRFVQEIGKAWRPETRLEAAE